MSVVRPKMESARIGRLTLMGELTASIAHEIAQPLAAIVTNGDYCLRQLGSATPNMEEVRQAIQDIVEDGNRACSIISRIRALLMKGRPEKVELQLNGVIREVVEFMRGDLNQNKIALKLELAADLPPVLGDRVQLQQAFMNVLINSIEALRSMPEERRELLVKGQKVPKSYKSYLLTPVLVLMPRLPNDSSNHSSQVNPTVWVWVCRSADRSSSLMVAGCRIPRLPAALSSNFCCRPHRKLLRTTSSRMSSIYSGSRVLFQ